MGRRIGIDRWIDRLEGIDIDRAAAGPVEGEDAGSLPGAVRLAQNLLHRLDTGPDGAGKERDYALLLAGTFTNAQGNLLAQVLHRELANMGVPVKVTAAESLFFSPKGLAALAGCDGAVLVVRTGPRGTTYHQMDQLIGLMGEYEKPILGFVTL